MIKQIFHAVETEEFFWQELTEEEISDRVTQQLDESRNDSTPLNIEIILQRIGIERSKERETGTIAKWLVEPWRGTARIHWLVSCAYISCPVSSLLVLVVAMEWGIRGSAQLPEWFKRFSWFKIVFGNGGLNPPILNMLLFSTTALANAIGAPFWAALATKVQPRLLLAVANAAPSAASDHHADSTSAECLLSHHRRVSTGLVELKARSQEKEGTGQFMASLLSVCSQSWFFVCGNTHPVINP